MAIAATISTVTPARIMSGAIDGRRNTAGKPSATIPSSTAVATNANMVVREYGTASAFQMPASPARLPRVPRPGSARAANGARPEDCELPSAVPSADAVSQGDAASTAMTNAAAPQRIRAIPVPGTAMHTRATVAASITPVGVRPASAIQNIADAHAARSAGPVRSRTTARATHGRQP